MGKQAIEILDLDVPQLIQMLNEAPQRKVAGLLPVLIGARLMGRPMRSEIEPELFCMPRRN